MDNPKVSIIVPIYRVEEYIERCAESLFAQTFDDIEYIFVDDCSPDKSVEILQRTLEKYPHRKRLTRIERLSWGTRQPPGGGQRSENDTGVLTANSVKIPAANVGAPFCGVAV